VIETTDLPKQSKNRVETPPKTTLRKSDQGKRKQKNKSAKKARKQNRK
jgi:hypothetical protein